MTNIEDDIRRFRERREARMKLKHDGGPGSGKKPGDGSKSKLPFKDEKDLRNQIRDAGAKRVNLYDAVHKKFEDFKMNAYKDDSYLHSPRAESDFKDIVETISSLKQAERDEDRLHALKQEYWKIHGRPRW